MSDNSVERRYRLDKKPPESGWSYLVPIGLALAIVNITKRLTSNQFN